MLAIASPGPRKANSAAAAAKKPRDAVRKQERKVTFKATARHTTSPATSPVPEDVTFVNPFVTSAPGSGSLPDAGLESSVYDEFGPSRDTTWGLVESGSGFPRERYTAGVGGLDLDPKMLKNSILKPVVARRSQSAVTLRPKQPNGARRLSRPKTTSSASCVSSLYRRRRLGADLYPVLHPDDLDRERTFFRSGVGVLASLFGDTPRSQSARWRSMGGGERNGRVGKGDYFCRASRAEACMNNAHLAKVFHMVPQRAVSAGRGGILPHAHGGTLPSPTPSFRLSPSLSSLCHRRASLDKAIANSSSDNITRNGNNTSRSREIVSFAQPNKPIETNNTNNGYTTHSNINNNTTNNLFISAAVSSIHTNGSGVANKDEVSKGKDNSDLNTPVATPQSSSSVAMGHNEEDVSEGRESALSQQRFCFLNARQLALRGVDLKHHHSEEWMEETRMKQEESVAILTEHLRAMLDGVEDLDIEKTDTGAIQASPGYISPHSPRAEEPGNNSRRIRRRRRTPEAKDNSAGTRNSESDGVLEEEDSVSCSAPPGMQDDVEKDGGRKQGGGGAESPGPALQNVWTWGDREGATEGRDLYAADSKEENGGPHKHGEPHANGEQVVPIDRLCMKSVSCEVLGPYACSDCCRLRKYEKQRQEQTALYPTLAVDPRVLVAPDKLRRLIATLPPAIRHSGQRVTLQCGCVVSMHPDFLFPLVVTDRDIHSRLMARRPQQPLITSSSNLTSSYAQTSPASRVDISDHTDDASSRTGSRDRASRRSRGSSREGSSASREGSSRKGGRRRVSGGTEEIGLDGEGKKAEETTMSPTDMKVTVRFTTPPEPGKGPSVFITSTTPDLPC